MMKDDNFKLLRGFADRGRTEDRRTDIGDCRVAFATENMLPVVINDELYNFKILTLFFY